MQQKKNQPLIPKEENTHKEATPQNPEPTHVTLTPATQINYVGPSASQTSLLKTAIATVRFDCTAIETNILFDEGAQRTFISQSLASKLNLQPTTKETMNLAAFGAVSPVRRNLIAAITYTNRNRIFRMNSSPSLDCSRNCHSIAEFN